MNQTRIKTPKRKLRGWVKFGLIPFLLVVLLVGGYGVHLYIKAGSTMNEAYEDDGRDKSDLRDDYVDPKFDNVTVLLMGIDENEKRSERGEPTRTDALILASLNKDDKSVKLLSIPRDSYVYIPEVGYEDKINHAHAFGGTRSTIDTVENLLDIPVDYYVKVNFNAFVDVVDAIGGIDVEVPYEFKESNSKDKRDSIHLMPGEQTLDGEEALALARTRKQDTDVMRGQRQLEIVDAMVSKVASVSSVLKYDDVIEAVGKNMSTNMTFTEMKSFFSYATHGSKIDIEKLSLEGYDYQPEGIYYWQLDHEELQNTINTLKAHLELIEASEEEPSKQDGLENNGYGNEQIYEEDNGYENEQIYEDNVE